MSKRGNYLCTMSLRIFTATITNSTGHSVHHLCCLYSSDICWESTLYQTQGTCYMECLQQPQHVPSAMVCTLYNMTRRHGKDGWRVAESPQWYCLENSVIRIHVLKLTHCILDLRRSELNLYSWKKDVFVYRQIQVTGAPSPALLLPRLLPLANHLTSPCLTFLIFLFPSPLVVLKIRCADTSRVMASNKNRKSPC